MKSVQENKQFRSAAFDENWIKIEKLGQSLRRSWNYWIFSLSNNNTRLVRSVLTS